MFRAIAFLRTVPLLPLALLLLPAAVSASDDSTLFSTTVAPNVLLLVDNSGSMHHIVWHPAYDPTATPTCNAFSNTGTYAYTTDRLNWSNCGKSINRYVDPGIGGSSTRFDGRYLNWLFSPESDPYNAVIEAANNGTYSGCVGGGSYSLFRRSRITAQKDILREVICQVNVAGEVRFGLAQFRRGSDPRGGYVRIPIDDYLDTTTGLPNVYTLDGATQSHGDHLGDAIDDLTGEAWTPLGESLFQVYTYFMTRDVGDRAVGKDGTTKFPEYRFRTDPVFSTGGRWDWGGTLVPPSPVEYACQKNFVIVITDGEPTKDHFANDGAGGPSPDDQGFENFLNELIGDYHNDGETETGYAYDGALYLDDIAKFMHENDFRPDLDGDQTFDVYTVGFTTTPAANAVLQKAADNANGIFYTSNDAEALAADIVDAVTDIIEKSASFTAATVPASRTSQGGQFYAAQFTPSRLNGFWEGHLKSWQITAAGEIHDKNGNCAVNDPTPLSCVAGPFKASAVPFWDAGDQVPAASARKLYTSRPTGSPGVSTRITFTEANTDAALLDLTAAELSLYPYPGAAAADAEELADMVVANVRGCEFGTGWGVSTCVARPWLLGDIFHSNAVIVGSPGAFFPEPSYKQFALDLKTRDRVIMAGANDGYFHLFHAGDWDVAAVPPQHDEGTGVEVAGFMPWPSRKKVKKLVIDGGNRDEYFVDATPTAADVWFYSSPTQVNKLLDGSEWRTMVLGGLRQGGNAYFALDISDPSSGTYPSYLWEFPREDAAASTMDYVGETWSRPLITKIRVKVGSDDNTGYGYERWVAIFGGGYDAKSDPNEHAAYDPAATAGRSLWVVDLKTGKVIASKKFDPTAPVGNPERDMLYAFASTPAVFDLDFDGYSDVIYIGDLGGNMWKWVIKDIGQDIVNGAGSEDQPDWKFKKFFAAPIYDDGSNKFYKSFYQAPSATLKSGKLWVLFGSGERTKLEFPGFTATTAENNRFYSMQDIDPLERLLTVEPTLTESNLAQITPDGSCAAVGGNRGFYFLGDDGEKFVTETDIFFYYVFVASYKPNGTGDPCDKGGDAYLYAFRAYCGEALFKDSGGNPTIRITLDDGLPTDPQISIGADAGTSRVIVSQSSGISGGGIPDDPRDRSGQVYWREMTQ